MKMTRIFSLLIATIGLVAFAVPVDAQSRGNRGNNNSNRGDMHRGGDRGDRGHHRHGGPRVNVYFGGFGYPYYGYYGSPYFYGSPYGYGSGYGYGYGYGSQVTPYYTYDPRGVYQGRVVNSRQATGNGSMNTRVQQQLAEGGYYRGEIDGVIGDGTRRAIRGYQRDNGLQVDGVIGDQLLNSMDLG